MLDNINLKGKHLTNSDRLFIEDALSKGYPLNKISKKLGKDSRTISKEIKRNRTIKMSKHDIKGGCLNRKSCFKKHLCNDSCNKLCKVCVDLNCMRVCTDYMIKSCNKLERYPHVCNDCDIKYSCKLDKYFYKAKHAQAYYEEKLSSSRKGINITPHELKVLDELITPLVKKGQPISHIYVNHKNEIKCSERTLYSYIDSGILFVRNIDLRRKVTYKPRRKKKESSKRTAHRTNRSYADFMTYIESNPNTEVVEMDTVIGTKGGKVLLTLFFRSCKIIAILLLEHGTQACVIQAFNEIYEAVGYDVFKSSLSICLTDNGSEFLDAEALEYDSKGNRRTKVFYCDPMASYQKGQIEKNHEFIKYVLPNGSSFDGLTQEKVTLFANHINSVSRRSLNGNTPFKLAEMLLDQRLLEVLSLKEIAPDQVHLKEELIDPSYIKKTLLDTIRG